MTPSEKLDLRNPPLAALLAWMVPGLGHWYQGRVGKAVLYFVCIMGLFLIGCRQGQWRVVYFRWDEDEWRWSYLAQIGVGLAALPALLHKAEWIAWMPERLQRFQAPPSDQELDKLHRTFGVRMDVAVIYTVIAGLLNILVVFDALSGPALYEPERTVQREQSRVVTNTRPIVASGPTNPIAPPISKNPANASASDATKGARA